MLHSLIKNKFAFSIVLLFAFYFSGILGIATNSKTIDFLSLTPLHLMVCAVLLLLNHQNGVSKQWLVFIAIGILGYFIEVLGVNTGLIFGEYSYGKTLGLKLFETPLAIGINWIVLPYSAVYTIHKIHSNKILVAALAATILVILDFLIEPVAIAFDFWSWTQKSIPINNYVAWYIISFCFSYLLLYFKGESTNRFAAYLLFFQFLFFSIFNII
jgi:putative membrane protein